LPSQKRPSLAAPQRIFATLTPRQAGALLSAIEAGYYEVPGRIRTTDIAGKQGLPRTTFEDRLRRAEGKVLHAVAPYLALYIGKEGL
jgi:hypothetical protein